jgi:signal transduction histidine kinase
MSPESAALVVHDLKNELGALEGALQVLALQPDAERATQAHRQCQDLRARMVSFLTLYGRNGELQAHSEDESPAEVLAALRSRCAARTPWLEVRAAPSAELPPYAFFDRRLLTLALEAALHNAARFATSSIELGARLEGGELVFTVEDDGPGLDHGVDVAPHNTGLGTQLCRAVARAHGLSAPDGGVSLTNRPQGGARFEIRLPT